MYIYSEQIRIWRSAAKNISPPFFIDIGRIVIYKMTGVSVLVIKVTVQNKNTVESIEHSV